MIRGTLAGAGESVPMEMTLPHHFRHHGQMSELLHLFGSQFAGFFLLDQFS
jgi:hypothetical protein